MFKKRESDKSSVTTFHDTYQWSVYASVKQTPLSWNTLKFD